MIILDKLSAAISNPREELSSFAPRIVTIKLPPDKIKDVIGPGGKVIRRIVQETGVTIDIDDDGTAQIASTEEAAMKKAVEMVKAIIEDPEVGKIYKGKVTRIMDFGAFCEILPGREGLCHVSELSDQFVKDVKEVVKLGDEIMVKLMEIDSQGRLNLSRKRAMNPDVEYEEPKKREKRERHHEKYKGGHKEGRNR